MYMYDWRTLANANRTYFKAIHRRSVEVILHDAYKLKQEYISKLADFF